MVLLALLNDVPIMMITYDNAPVAERPGALGHALDTDDPVGAARRASA